MSFFHFPTRWLSYSQRVFNIMLLIISILLVALCRILCVLLHRQRERGMYCWGAFSRWLVDESMQVLGGCDYGCPAYFHNNLQWLPSSIPPISDNH